MLFRPSPSSGVPVYLQLIEQVRHAIDVGALRPGDQLPAIRRVAEDLVINPNTVAKAYRELEQAGVIDLRHGSGAFVAQGRPMARVPTVRRAQPILQATLERLAGMGVTPEEIRRLFEAELMRLDDRTRARKP
jgi:GntR family transcriptional regulator